MYYLWRHIFRDSLVLNHISKNLPAPGQKDPQKPISSITLKTHLSQAKEGDVVLFYFAGHGVREVTHLPAFRRVESDDCLATLVCYDTRVQSGPGMSGTTLADKELRYLLQKYLGEQGAHVVVITDCCHSGGNSRNLQGGVPLTGEDPGEDLSSRLARPRPIGARRYDGFLFHQEIPLEMLEPESAFLDDILPQASHIQMAACRDVEEAWEARRNDGSVGGYFTITLLEILQNAGGGISYYDLKNRATNRMRNMKKRPQTPQIFASGNNPNELYRNFLTGAPGKQPTYCTVAYNEQEGWTINLGAIHGIPVNTDQESVEVFIQDGQGNHFIAQTLVVNPGFSQIKFLEAAPDKEAMDLKGYIEGIATQPISICLTGDQAGIEPFLQVFQESSPQGQNPSLSLVQTEDAAEYVVRAQEAMYQVTLPFDGKPLIEPVEEYSQGSAKLLYDYLIHISRWNFIQKLSHPETQLHKYAPINQKMYPVEMQLFQQTPNGGEVEIDLSENSVELQLDQADDKGIPFTRIRLKLTNHSNQELYCSMVYMSTTFAAFPTLLAEKGVWLGEKEEAEANDGKYITIRQEPYLAYYGWDQSLDFIKLIISTQQFDPMIMYLRELPKPPTSFQAKHRNTDKLGG